jgi:hypothetical protein
VSEALTADGFDEAIIGLGRQFNNEVVVYDEDKCIQILMSQQKMSKDKAVEFFEFNVACAYLGEGTPVFVVVGKHKKP